MERLGTLLLRNKREFKFNSEFFFGKEVVRFLSSERNIVNKLLNESRVGAFYIIGGNVVSDDVDVRDGDEYGDFINYSSHWDLWRGFVRTHPKFKSNNYDDYPRGRVVFNKKINKYVLYLDPKLNNPTDIMRIRVVYKLSSGSYVIGNDEHYSSKYGPKDGSLKDNVIFRGNLDKYIKREIN